MALILSFPTVGNFFLPGPLWGRTVFCIDIGNITLIHIVKLHLPHMYMIFVECKRKQVCSSILQYRQTFQHFRIISDPLKPFAPFGSWKFFWLSFTTITGSGTRRVKTLLIRFEKRSERLKKPNDQSQKKRRKCFSRS